MHVVRLPLFIPATERGFAVLRSGLRAYFLALGISVSAACNCFAEALPVEGGVTLHVGPDGNDAWSGRLEKPNADRSDGPLATLAGARNAIRRSKAQGPLKQPVVVSIAAGVYLLADTLVFEPQDSGTAAAPIVYRAADGARPAFTGGRTIHGFRPDEARTLESPSARGAGRPSGTSRTSTSTAAARPAPESPTSSTTMFAAKAARRCPTARSARIRKTSLCWRPCQRIGLNDAVIVAYFSWENTVSRVAAVDPRSGTVVLTGDAPWKFERQYAGWGPRLRFHIENVKAALDAPGEWFLDRDGDLFYIPLPGEDPAKAEVVAPALTELVRFSGDPQAGRYVEQHHDQGAEFSTQSLSTAAPGPQQQPGRG